MTQVDLNNYSYVGTELDLFAKARNWKGHWSKQIRAFVSGSVLDVGAGQGNNLDLLLDPSCTEWTCLEPDQALLDKIQYVGSSAADPRVKLVCGDTMMLRNRAQAPLFDSVIYIDVMEHIEDDEAEFERAADLLKPGGWLIVLSPAFQSLYSPFDEEVGHFRRYDRPGLECVSAEGLKLRRTMYLDSLGFLLSAANRLILKQSMPRLEQILFWDRWVVPVSRLVDPILGRWMGRSIIGVWQKSES